MSQTNSQQPQNGLNLDQIAIHGTVDSQGKLRLRFDDSNPQDVALKEALEAYTKEHPSLEVDEMEQFCRFLQSKRDPKDKWDIYFSRKSPSGQ
ncbi:hypothetical protein E5D57_001349 [Metarhizium anisopliae]|nr:hypothetical protein E5D57_001349 [Metarhizium anisopliae]